MTGNQPFSPRPGGAPGLRRGKSVLGRETDENTNESGLNLFKRGATIRRKASRAAPRPAQAAATRPPEPSKSRGCCAGIAPGPVDSWMIYCFMVTCWVPNFIISKVFGKRTPESQRAWREKMGIVVICAFLMAVVGYITFGFTQTVCGKQDARLRGGQVNNGSVVVNGYAYELAAWNHPVAGDMFNGSTNPLYMDEWNVGGDDLSFMFQTNVNKNCYGLISNAQGSPILNSDGGKAPQWYFPCTPHSQISSSPINETGYESSKWCHLSVEAREGLEKKRSGTVFYSWDQIKSGPRTLVVYRG